MSLMSQANQPEQLTFLALASPAKTSVWPENEQDWKGLEAACSGKFAEFYENSLRPRSLLSGLFSKTSPACFLRVKDATLPSCSTPWMNSGMVWRGVCLTRSFSESPNAAEECSLSDVLESHVPERFFLSPRAAAGILRRAEKRERLLPEKLQQALEVLAGRADTSPMPNNPREDISLPMLPTACAKTQEESAKGTTQPTLSLETCETAAKDQLITSPRRSTELPTQIEKPNTLDSLPVPSVDPTGTTATAAHAETDRTTSSFSKLSLPSGPKDQADLREMSTTTLPSAELSGIGADQALKRLDQTDLSVRRLTPTECETLQAFPKGWTVPGTEHWGTRSRRMSLAGSEGE